MKKFKVSWFKGTIEGLTRESSEVIIQKFMEANSINEVSYLDILPNSVKEKIRYSRGIIYSDKKLVIDYGSWIQFIEIEEV